VTWRDQLQKGKFRDAEFYTEADDGIIGRRVQVHEYPLRDKPYVEDLGRKGREFTLDLYVLGDDYMAARDRLIAAIEKPGPGPLVHHWMGLMQASVVDCRISHSTREGGMCRFVVTFVEGGENTYPSALTDTRSYVNTQADAGVLAEIDAFADGFSIAGVASFVSSAASTIASGGIDRLIAVAGLYFGGVALASFITQALSIKSSVSTLLGTPRTFAQRWTGLLGSLFEIDDSNPVRGVAAYKALTTYGSTLPAISPATAQRQVQAANQAALLGLIQRSALIEETRTTRLREFDSYNQAAAVRDDLADRLDTAMETAPDNVYLTLQGLRAATVRDITARSADLSRVIQYTPKTTLPALVVAHQLYGDAAKEADIITRNKSVRHPGFVRGGQALEVLSV
jgi:prophage DNA circulation protein